MKKLLLASFSFMIIGISSQAETQLELVTPETRDMRQVVKPLDWSAWAKWVGKLMPVADEEGHGPDVGSDEWAHALAKKLEVADDEDGPEFKSANWQEAVESQLMPEPKEDASRQLLSSHQVIGRLIGFEDKKCRGRTLLCPDDCGHSGKVVSFKVQQYENYLKPGRYGDEKQDIFRMLVEDNKGNRQVSDVVYRSLMDLKKGQVVRLRWNHDYVTKDGSKFPERPLIAVVPVDFSIACILRDEKDQ